jgi:hypothetical protein
VTQPGQVRVEKLGERSRNPYRLGRHIEHDPRSFGFAAPVLPRSAILSRKWTRRVGVFDQGDWSSCTGQAAAGWVATDNAARPGLTEVDGVPVSAGWARDVVYHLATTFDQFLPDVFPPTDTGSSGIGAAKALKSLGLCTSYRHPFSLQAGLSEMQTGPVLLGLPWHNSMWEPDPAGRIRVDTSSGLGGGHEVLADEVDVDLERVWIQNSWSASWGQDGRAWFALDDLATLLAADGDVTAPVPAPAPAPAPPAAGCALGPITRMFRARRQETP